MDDSTKIKVVNRLSSPVIYFVPDMNNLRREFHAREEKIVTLEELRKVSYDPGGMVILKDCLIIKDKQAIEELGLHVEPEYFYEKEQVIDLLQNGSMDEFLDCLDFAPDGVIDLIKEQSVALPLNDVAKREVLKEKFGFDVAKIIEIRDITTEGEEETEQKASGRRVTSQSKGSQSGRRVVKVEK